MLEARSLTVAGRYMAADGDTLEGRQSEEVCRDPVDEVVFLLLKKKERESDWCSEDPGTNQTGTLKSRETQKERPNPG